MTYVTGSVSSARGNAGSVDRPTVAFVLDRAYVPWAGIAMLSCHESSAGTGVDFEVLHDGSLDAHASQELGSVLEGTSSTLRFHSFDRTRIAGLPTTSDFGTIVWLRFFLPEVLSGRKRVLYLDGDTLVRGSIAELWATGLEGHPVGAVANVVEPALRGHVRQFGVEYPGGFFNSGVLLMDLDAMRGGGSTDRLIRFAVSNADRLLWPDQDALNAVFRLNWMNLHPKWNVQNSFWSWREWALEVFGQHLLDEAVDDSRIRHFEGPSLSKPWHFLCTAPMVRDYRSVWARSPWATLPLEDRTAATLAIRRLPERFRVTAYKRLVRLRTRLGN